jgi:hypothetical protein
MDAELGSAHVRKGGRIDVKSIGVGSSHEGITQGHSARADRVQQVLAAEAGRMPLIGALRRGASGARGERGCRG